MKKLLFLYLVALIGFGSSASAQEYERVRVTTDLRIVTLRYAEVGLPTSGLIPVFAGGKMGFVNMKGEEVLAPLYDKDQDALSYRFCDGMMRVKKNGLYGFVDTGLKEVIPCQFEASEDFQNGYAAVKKNGLWGFVNSKGEVVVSYGYKRVAPFSNGLAAVVNESDSLGFVNEMGLLVIPFQFDNKSNPEFNELGFCEVWRAGTKSYINRAGGDTIVGDYLALSMEGKSTASVNLKAESKKLNRLVPYELANTPYDEIKPLSDGYFLVMQKKNGRFFGVLSSDGREVVPCEYDNVMGPFSNHFVVEKEGKQGAIKLDGSKFLSCEYQQIGRSGTELVWVRKDDKVGFVNMKGELVIPCQYEDARPFHCGVTSVMVRKKDKMVWNFIDKTGKVVADPEYDDAMSFENGICPVKHKGKWGFVDESCKEIISCKYDYSFSDYKERWSYRHSEKGDWIPVMKDNKYGYIDLSGKVMIPFQYEEASAFLKHGLAVVQQHGRKWFLDHSGKTHEFMPASNVKEMRESVPALQGYAPVQIVNKWGVKNAEGRIVVPCIYDGVEIFATTIVVRVLNKKGLVNGEGVSLIPTSNPLRQTQWIPMEDEEMTLPKNR